MAKTKALATVDEAAVARVNALLPGANDGDRCALAELREVLDSNPELWKALGALRRELTGPAPTPLERLLVDRVALGWLGLTAVEGAYHRALEGGLDRSDDEFHQKRVERAQRRYLAAIKALATVRRLGVPALQVNVADKQVNVAG